MIGLVTQAFSWAVTLRAFGPGARWADGSSGFFVSGGKDATRLEGIETQIGLNMSLLAELGIFFGVGFCYEHVAPLGLS